MVVREKKFMKVLKKKIYRNINLVTINLHWEIKFKKYNLFKSSSKSNFYTSIKLIIIAGRKISEYLFAHLSVQTITWVIWITLVRHSEDKMLLVEKM